MEASLERSFIAGADTDQPALTRTRPKREPIRSKFENKPEAWSQSASVTHNKSERTSAVQDTADEDHSQQAPQQQVPRPTFSSTDKMMMNGDRKYARPIAEARPLAKGHFYSEARLSIHAEYPGISASQRIFVQPSLFTNGSTVSAEELWNMYKDGQRPSMDGILLKSHIDYYNSEERLDWLEEGGVLFSFSCRTWLDPLEEKMVQLIANLSSFDDETTDNYVPHFDAKNPSDMARYTFVLQRSAYLLPGVPLSVLTPELLSSVDYHKACQPTGTRIWDDKNEPNTFRMTRPIIPRLYYITIQFKVSRLGRDDLDALSKVFGLRIDVGLLMERTKRHVPPKQDATAKAKSVLLVRPLACGTAPTCDSV